MASNNKKNKSIEKIHHKADCVRLCVDYTDGGAFADAAGIQQIWSGKFLNSLFTATSATCVTGLVVADTYQN